MIIIFMLCISYAHSSFILNTCVTWQWRNTFGHFNIWCSKKLNISIANVDIGMCNFESNCIFHSFCTANLDSINVVMQTDISIGSLEYRVYNFDFKHHIFQFYTFTTFCTQCKLKLKAHIRWISWKVFLMVDINFRQHKH